MPHIHLKWSTSIATNQSLDIGKNLLDIDVLLHDMKEKI